MKTVDTKIYEFDDVVIVSMIIGDVQEIYCRQPNKTEMKHCCSVPGGPYFYDDEIRDLHDHKYFDGYFSPADA